MICGVVPYGEDIEDPYEVFHSIMSNKQVYYPPIFNKMSHSSAKKLIQQLLSHDPEGRITRQGFYGLKTHEFFADFDFDDLES